MRHEKAETHRPETMSPDEQALAYLKKNGSASVEMLYSVLAEGNPSLTKSELTDLVWRLVEKGQVDVEDVPPATKSLREYLGFWERNLWLYLSLAVALMTLLAIYAFPSRFPLVILRWVFGGLFVLFIPGFMLIEALFPKGRELEGVERFALSIGLSLALVPLVGLLLNYTPWGIRQDPIVVSLTILAVGLAIVGFVRRFRLSAERFDLQKLT